MKREKSALERFELQRPQLRAVAYRMLGSTAEADDAVQEAWIRLSRSDVSEIENLGGWLTTVVGRICLNILRSRRSRGEEPLEEVHVPDPIVGPADAPDPEQEALVADSVGLALAVVLETLRPAERLCFVLHDIFAIPFDEIAPMLDRSPQAARQLASRARRRIRAGGPIPEGSIAAQRKVVDAFFAAGRAGDFQGLIAVLDPEVTLRADFGAGAATGLGRAVGAPEVAERALMFAHPDREVVAATVNGAAGAVIVTGARPLSIMGFTVVGPRIKAIDVLADPRRIARLDLEPALGR